MHSSWSKPSILLYKLVVGRRRERTKNSQVTSFFSILLLVVSARGIMCATGLQLFTKKHLHELFHMWKVRKTKFCTWGGPRSQGFHRPPVPSWARTAWSTSWPGAMGCWGQICFQPENLVHARGSALPLLHVGWWWWIFAMNGDMDISSWGKPPPKEIKVGCGAEPRPTKLADGERDMLRCATQTRVPSAWFAHHREMKPWAPKWILMYTLISLGKSHFRLQTQVYHSH